MKEKNIEDIKSLLGQDAVKAIDGKTYVFPRKADLIPQLVRLALQEKFKILPLGNQTQVDLSGISEEQTLFLRLNNLSQVKRIVPEDLFVVVEPGFNLRELNSLLSEHNLFYPLSLEDFKGTAGGAVATGLSAEDGEKKVSTKELVLALEVVNSSGQVFKSGAEVFKSVTGYDTTRLLIGSWGSLGIFTSVSLRILPLNRKKEFGNLKPLPNRFKRPKDEDPNKANLNRRIKKLLDPQGLFVELS